MAGKKVLLPRADIARKVLPDTLRTMGADVTEATAYKTVSGTGNTELLKEMLAEKRIHILTFTSSSTVKNFVKKIDQPNLPELLKGTVIACIGPITANTARELGLKVDVEATEYTIDGMIAAILAYLEVN
ncbi:MAG: uroporphyrinogen-III synthase, partial [Bacillota bacterium]